MNKFRPFSDKLIKILLAIFSISFALSASYATAWVCCGILLPKSIDIDALLISMSFFHKAWISILTLGLLSTTFTCLYLAYHLLKISIKSD